MSAIDKRKDLEDNKISEEPNEDEDNEKHYVTEIVAERLTFLSSSKPKENEEKKSSKKKKVDE